MSAAVQPASPAPSTPNSASPQRRKRKVSERAMRFFRKNSQAEDGGPEIEEAQEVNEVHPEMVSNGSAISKPSPIGIPPSSLAATPVVESPSNMSTPRVDETPRLEDARPHDATPATTSDSLPRPSLGTPTTARQKSFFGPRRSSTAMTAPIGAIPVITPPGQSSSNDTDFVAVDHAVPAMNTEPQQRQRPMIKVRIITWNHGNTVPKGDLEVLLGRVGPYVPPEPGWDISYDSESDGSEEEAGQEGASPEEQLRRDESRQKRRALRGQWAAGQEKTARADRIPPLPHDTEHPYHVIVIAGQECPWGDGKRIATGMGMAGELSDIALARSKSKAASAAKKDKVEKKPSVSRRGSQNDLKTPGAGPSGGTAWSNEFPFGQKASANGARTPNVDGATTPGVPGTPTTQHRHLAEEFGDRVNSAGWAISGKGWSDMCEDWMCRGAGSQHVSTSHSNAPSAVSNSDLKSAASSSDLNGNKSKGKDQPKAKPDLHIDVAPSPLVTPSKAVVVTPTPPSAAESIGSAHLSVPGGVPPSASTDSNASDLQPLSASPSNSEPNEWGVIRAPPSPSVSHTNLAYADGKHDATPKCLGPYELVIKERMLGCYMAVYVWRGCKDRVRGYSRDHVKSGLLAGRVGNKGGCGISLKLGETRLLFVNAHLAAHEGRVAERLANVMKIKTELDVDNFLPEGDPRSLYEDVTERFDHCFWAGDLNFRVDISRKHADWLLLQRAYEQALEFDQLRSVLKEGIVFYGFHEAPINFPPTYKYDVLKTLKPRRAKTIRNRIIHVRSGSKGGVEAVAVPAALVEDNQVLRTKASDITADSGLFLSPAKISQAVQAAKRQSQQDATENSNASLTDEDTDESPWDAFTKGALESDVASLNSDAEVSGDCTADDKGAAAQSKGFSQGAAVKAKYRFLEIMRAATATAMAGHKGRKQSANDSDADSIAGVSTARNPHPLKRKLSSKPASSTPALPTVVGGSSSARSSISADCAGDSTVEILTGDSTQDSTATAMVSGDKVPKTVSGSVIKEKRRPAVRRRSSADDLSRETSITFGIPTSTSGDTTTTITQEEQQAYDTSAKQRVPSWCDRVLWRSTVVAEDEQDQLTNEPETEGFGSRMSRGISQALLIPQIKQATHRRELRRAANTGGGPAVSFAVPEGSQTNEFGTKYSPLTTPHEPRSPLKDARSPVTPASARSPFRRLFHRKRHTKVRRHADTVSLHEGTPSAQRKEIVGEAPRRAAVSAVDLPSQLLRRTSEDVAPTVSDHRRKSSVISRASTLLSPGANTTSSSEDAPPTPTVTDDVVGAHLPPSGTSRRAASWWADRVGSRLPSILTPQGAVAALASLGVFGSEAAAAAAAKDKDGDALLGPKRGRVECLLYTTLNDREMRVLEGRSDHRPVIFVAAVGI